MPIRKELRPLYRTPEYKAARAACRERANDHCEQCGKLNGQLEWRFAAEEAAHQVLIQCGAAHLDNDPSNNAPKNLKWLCRGCHLRTDAMHHKHTRATRKDAARPLLMPEAWGAAFEGLGKEQNDDA